MFRSKQLLPFLVVVLMSSLLFMSGCGKKVPVQNYQGVAIPASNLSEDKIEQAIIRGGSSLGWVMQKVSPGNIQATLNLRTHQAIVNINYTDTIYSIQYVSSVNLKYKDGKIHRNYNSWIRNLTTAINRELSMAQ